LVLGRFGGWRNFPYYSIGWLDYFRGSFPILNPVGLGELTPKFRVTPFRNLVWAQVGFGPRVSRNLGKYSPGKLSFNYSGGNFGFPFLTFFPGGKGFGTFGVERFTARICSPFLLFLFGEIWRPYSGFPPSIRKPPSFWRSLGNWVGTT